MRPQTGDSGLKTPSPPTTDFGGRNWRTLISVRRGQAAHRRTVSNVRSFQTWRRSWTHRGTETCAIDWQAECFYGSGR